MEWFKHDIDAHDDIKIRKLVRMHGLKAYGLYWYLVELLYKSGGLMSQDSILDESLLMGMEEDEAMDVMDSFIELGLFQSSDEGWTSKRVQVGLEESNTVREKMRELGKRSGAKRQRLVNDTSTARQRHVNDTLNERRRDKKENKDNNISRDYQEGTSSFTKKSKTDQTDIVCSELLSQDSVGADSGDPVFLTIQTNQGEEYPVTEGMVKSWQETFPAVDVKAHLRRMKTWSMDNPKQRKTSKGMRSFISRWLSREQDKAGRVPDMRPETIKGTNIQMSFTADGTRPDQEYEEVHFE